MAYLNVYWSPSRGDHLTTATQLGKDSAKVAAYESVGQNAQVDDAPGPGLVPLKLFYSDQRQDNFTTATGVGEEDAIAAGYRFVRIEGYVRPAPQPRSADLVPLKLYWHEGRGDNFLTTGDSDEQEATASGYRFVRIEAFARPLWKL